MRTDLEAPVTEPGTPLPWQYRDDYTTEGFVTIIGNVDGEYVDGQASCTYDVVCRCEDEFGERLPNVAHNVRYIVTACNAYPQLLALVQEMVGALEKGAEQFDLLSKLSQVSRISEIDKGTGRKVPRRKGDVLQSEAECGAAYLRATLTRAKGVMGQ